MAINLLTFCKKINHLGGFQCKDCHAGRRKQFTVVEELLWLLSSKLMQSESMMLPDCFHTTPLRQPSSIRKHLNGSYSNLGSPINGHPRYSSRPMCGVELQAAGPHLTRTGRLRSVAKL